METELIQALTHRKDRYALELIEKHPELLNENTIRLALDHGCVKVIRYLRENDLLTAEGAVQRQTLREEDYQKNLNELEQYLPELEKFFD